MMVEVGLGLIRAFVTVWDIATLPIYLLIYRPWERIRKMHAPRTKIVYQSATEIAVQCFEQTCATKEEIMSLPVRLDTIDKLFHYLTQKFKGKRCLGTRQLLSEERISLDEGKTATKVTQGEYEWKTYDEVFQIAKDFGKGLRAIGIKPRDKVVIYADTRAEWFMSALGCFTQNFIITTIYTNLGDDGIVFGINQSDAKAVITSQELLPKLQQLRDACPAIQHIVYFEPKLQQVEYINDNDVKSYHQILTLGRRSDIPAEPPTADDVALIMFTSGSTGEPKGVVITHRNFTSTLYAGCPRVCQMFGETRKSSDAFIAYLPLAHIFELTHEMFALMIGFPVGYSSPHTLSDKSVMIRPGDKGDINVLRPSYMLAVPLILDRIYKGIKGMLTQRGPFFSKFFQFCVEYRLHWNLKGYDTPILNWLIFRKVKASLGGNVFGLCGGGAPLAPDVHDFLRTCLNTCICQGYGLTETVGGVCCADDDDLQTGTIGFPLVDAYMKLINWEEGGYTVKDSEGPRGEIVVGGEQVCQGYYKMPEKTAECFYEERGVRWFKTGDIGQLMPNGTFKIIDRKKDLVKLPNGEYISLGKVEAYIKTHPIVDTICVVANSMKRDIVALVVTDENYMKLVGELLGYDKGYSHRDLCNDPGVIDYATRALREHGAKKLQKFELPKRVTLLADPWLPESGLVTAAMKLKRREISVRFQDDINQMFSELL